MLYLIASVLSMGTAVGLFAYVTDDGFDKRWQDAVAAGAAASLIMLSVATLIIGIISFCAE